MKIQPRLPHGERRLQLPASAPRAIRHAVERDARRWDCSMTWIVTTIQFCAARGDADPGRVITQAEADKLTDVYRMTPEMDRMQRSER